MEKALFILFSPLGVINGVKVRTKKKKKKRDLKKEKIRAPSDAWKDYLKTWGIKTPAARVNVLMQVGLWPTAIKLNPL